MILFRYFFFILCITAFLASCTSPKKPLSQADIPVEILNVANRKAAAKEYFDNRNYAAALTQWKILRTIAPDNIEYQNRISVLTTLVNRRAKLHFKAGNDAMKEKNYALAKEAFLKALAMNPRHEKSLDMLRKIESNLVEKAQRLKTTRLEKKEQAKHKSTQKKQAKKKQIQIKKTATTENIFLKKGISLHKKEDWSGSIRELEKYLATNGQDQSAKTYLAKSHIKLSEVFEARGHLEPAIQHVEDAIKHTEPPSREQQQKLQSLKHELAQNYYISGIKAYRNNISQAITYWERAVDYNPDHSKATKRLAKARQIKENLQKIKPQVIDR